MRTQPLLHGLILGASLLALWPAAAQARPEYPGAIMEAAGMTCVPTCLLCHVDSPGHKGTWTSKPVGNALSSQSPPFVAGDEDTVAPAWNAFVAFANANPTAVCVPDAMNPANVVLCKDMPAMVQAGIEPKTKQNVCGPTYGCGATVAQRPLSESQNNRDPAPAVAAALAAIAGLFAMRRRRR